MSREWKPGDVATFGGGAAVRTVRGWVYSDGSEGDLLTHDKYARPLVVIDPENREQAIDLLAAYIAQSVLDPPQDRMQNALRSLVADPKPPKPDEPQGLGAVVEDDDGHKWVRVYGTAMTDDYDCWKRAEMTTRHPYSEVNAVRVLSEGWSE